MRLAGLSISELLMMIIAVILSMSVHELAHGLVSYWLGDPSAKYAGRLSLNPLRHIDWLGMFCLLAFGFGWARPVPIDSRYYKDPKSRIIWTSFAGPLANFLLGFVCVFGRGVCHAHAGSDRFDVDRVRNFQPDPYTASGRGQDPLELSARSCVLPHQQRSMVDESAAVRAYLQRTDWRTNGHVAHLVHRSFLEYLCFSARYLRIS